MGVRGTRQTGLVNINREVWHEAKPRALQNHCWTCSSFLSSSPSSLNSENCLWVLLSSFACTADLLMAEFANWEGILWLLWRREAMLTNLYSHMCATYRAKTEIDTLPGFWTYLSCTPSCLKFTDHNFTHTLGLYGCFLLVKQVEYMELKGLS
jgi:hypothetical protein